MKKRMGKIAVGLVLLIIAFTGLLLAVNAFAASGSYPGVGNTLPFDSVRYDLSSFTKIYYNLIRSDGQKVTAADGSLSTTITWAQAGIDCAADTDFKYYKTVLPSGLSSGGNYLIRWWGSNDATADSGDTLLGIGYVPIMIVGGSPAFSDLPQSF